jgi:Transposase DDE domain
MHRSYRAQSRAAIAAVLPAADLRRVDRRCRDRWGYYPLACVWLFAAVSRGASLAERFADARSWLRGLAPRLRLATSYRGFAQAVRRKGEVLAVWLTAAFQERLMAFAGDADLVGGWRPLAVDGTRFDCPRSRSCQRAYRRAGRPGSPPQLGLVTLWHLGAHCWWDGRVGPAVIAERTLLRAMLDDLPPRALLVGDAGFVGYGLCEELGRRGVAFLLRVGANVELLTRLGAYRRESADTVYLWPQRDRRRRRPLPLRLVVAGTGKRRVYLVTNVLSRTALSRARAADFYRRRWGVETAYRAVKQTLARRRLLSRSADLAALELAGVFLAGWAVSLLALFARGRPAAARAWSPAQAAAALRGFLSRPAARGRSLRRALARAVPTPSRPGRRKTRQRWPHKKNDPPCGRPRLTRASRPLARQAQRVMAAAA